MQQSPTKRENRRSSGPAIICYRNSFSSCNSFSSSNDGTASRVDLRREDRAGPAAAPPNCRSVPLWVRNERLMWDSLVCRLTIKNSIICWNYLYLTRKIAMAKTDEERKMLLDIIATHSPQSWSGINMLGEFDFSDEKLQDTTGVLPPKKQAKIIPENWFRSQQYSYLRGPICSRATRAYAKLVV